MADVSQIRQLVNSAIGSKLGIYNLPDGSTCPSLWVRGQQQVPKDWTISGIECVIDEVPEMVNQPTLSQQVILSIRWPIYLTSYDTAQTLAEVRALLFQWFPDIQDPVHVAQTDISFETLKVFIPDYSIQPEKS
jgi:hypothetical protein